MPHLQFRGAIIRFFKFVSNGEGQFFARLDLTCDYSEPIREALSMPQFPEGVDSMDLEAEIQAQGAVFEPADAKLKLNSLQFDAGTVDHFKAVRVTTDGVSTIELRFQMRSSSVGIAGALETYMRTVGAAPALLAITHATQATLDAYPPEVNKQMNLRPEDSETVVVDENGEATLAGPAAERVLAIDAEAVAVNRPLINHQAGGRRKRQPVPPGASDPEATEAIQ